VKIDTTNNLQPDYTPAWSFSPIEGLAGTSRAAGLGLKKKEKRKEKGSPRKTKRMEPTPGGPRVANEMCNVTQGYAVRCLLDNILCKKDRWQHIAAN